MIQQIFVVLFTILAFAMGTAPNVGRAAERPNVLLIFTDDQGFHDVGCYGSEIPTPQIDRIARNGMKFNAWYSASSICTPSRFGLLTGTNPSRSHDRLLSALMFMSPEHKAKGIRPQEQTIATRLAAAGYDTALIGKWHLGHGGPQFWPTEHGFGTFIGHTGGCIDYFTMTYGIIPDWYHQDKLVTENGYATELITQEAVDYLQERRSEEPPFFLFLAYNAPHFGKGWSPQDQAPVNIMQPQAGDLNRVENIEDKIRREYAAMVTSLDNGVGQILDKLQATGMDRDTLVIFLTDHGGDPVYGGSNLPLRGGKATLFEGGLRVPCLMQWPGRIPSGSVCEAVCSSLDIFPTLCKLAGIDSSAQQLDGKNISPLWEGKRPWSARSLFWELGAHSELGRMPWRALRQGDWKYIASPDDEELLFHIAKDPHEQKDLSSTETDKLDKLRTKSRSIAQRMHGSAE